MAIFAAQHFVKALADAGVIPPAERVRRVVIDADRNHLVVIHVEMIGDDRVLEVVPTLQGVEVRTTDQQPAPNTFQVRTLGQVDWEYADSPEQISEGVASGEPTPKVVL